MEKKKIKIVAKKTAPSLPVAEKAAPVVPEASPESSFHEEPAAPAPYTPRKVQLPESGKLDLGTKFVSRPAVVFHNRPAPSQNSSGSSRPSFPGPNRPRFSGSSQGGSGG